VGDVGGGGRAFWKQQVSGNSRCLADWLVYTATCDVRGRRSGQEEFFSLRHLIRPPVVVMGCVHVEKTGMLDRLHTQQYMYIHRGMSHV
jgi:hypothetical protein